MEEKTFTASQASQWFAVDLNRQVWELIDKPSRTLEEDEEMLLAAYASCYHWLKIGAPINLQRGHWLISHVYSILGRGEPALFHARKCLDLTKTHHVGDFDQAYACEAMARAYAVVGERAEWEKYFMLAEKAAESIKDPDDRDLFIKDLAREPWYGLKI